MKKLLLTLIIPFLTVITEPERLFGLKKFGFIYELLNIDNESELLIPVSLLFISASVAPISI